MQLSNYLCWSFRDFLQRIIISKDFKPQAPWSLSKQLRSWQWQMCTKGLALSHSPGSLYQYFRRKKRGCNSHCDKTVSMGRRCESCLHPHDSQTESHRWDHSQGTRRRLILCLTKERPMFFISILKETPTYWLRVTTELKYNVCLLVWKALIFPPTGYL